MTLRRGREKVPPSAEEYIRRLSAAECGPAKIHRRDLALFMRVAELLWQNEFRKSFVPLPRVSIKEAAKRKQVWTPNECLKFAVAYYLATAAAASRYAELLTEAVAWRFGLNGNGQSWIREELIGISHMFLNDLEQRVLGELLTDFPVIATRRQGRQVDSFRRSKAFENALKSIRDRVVSLGLPPNAALARLELAVAVHGTRNRFRGSPRIGILPPRDKEPSMKQDRVAEILGLHSTRQVRNYIKNGMLTLVGKKGVVLNDDKLAALWRERTDPKPGK